MQNLAKTTAEPNRASVPAWQVRRGNPLIAPCHVAAGRGAEGPASRLLQRRNAERAPYQPLPPSLFAPTDATRGHQATPLLRPSAPAATAQGSSSASDQATARALAPCTTQGYDTKLKEAWWVVLSQVENKEGKRKKERKNMKPLDDMWDYNMTNGLHLELVLTVLKDPSIPFLSTLNKKKTKMILSSATQHQMRRFHPKTG